MNKQNEEYIRDFRASFGGILDNTVIERPDGVYELDGDMAIGDFIELMGYELIKSSIDKIAFAKL